MELIHETLNKKKKNIYIYIYILHIYKEGVEREEMELAVPDGTLTEAKNLYHNRFYIYSTSIFIYTYTYG